MIAVQGALTITNTKEERCHCPRHRGAWVRQVEGYITTNRKPFVIQEDGGYYHLTIGRPALLGIFGKRPDYTDLTAAELQAKIMDAL